jgi:hypothetical protein
MSKTKQPFHRLLQLSPPLLRIMGSQVLASGLPTADLFQPLVQRENIWNEVTI